MKVPKFLIPAVVVIGVFLFQSLFIVQEINQAIVLQFGDPKKIISKAGLNFKLPFGVWVGDSTGSSSSGVGGDMAGVQHEKAHRLGFRIGWGRGCPCRGLPDGKAFLPEDQNYKKPAFLK